MNIVDWLDKPRIYETEWSEQEWFEIIRSAQPSQESSSAYFLKHHRELLKRYPHPIFGWSCTFNQDIVVTIDRNTPRYQIARLYMKLVDQCNESGIFDDEGRTLVGPHNFDNFKILMRSLVLPKALDQFT